MFSGGFPARKYEPPPRCYGCMTGGLMLPQLAASHLPVDDIEVVGFLPPSLVFIVMVIA